MTPVVTFSKFIKEFPNIKSKSKELAKKILPLYASPKLAEIIAAILTDGHIDWYTSDDRPRPRKTLLYSDVKEECKWFLKTCKDIFGINGEAQKYHSTTGYSEGDSYRAVIHNATLARTLILAGAPAGDKTKVGYLIPKWILAGSQEIKKDFLRILYNFDGCKPYKRRNTWTIHYSLTTSKPTLKIAMTFINQLRKLLTEFDIRISKSPTQYLNKGKIVLIFSISSRESITNFYRNIEFLNPEKQRRLEFAVRDLSKFARISLPKSLKILQKFKDKIGTDKKAVKYVNEILRTNYTYRQFEHFRRNETKVPILILSVVEETLKKKIKIPEWARFLIQNFVNVYSCH
ncbi:hypothetical protein GW869_01575 [bacterium]|nr:hypothetical protein [bacterium]